MSDLVAPEILELFRSRAPEYLDELKNAYESKDKKALEDVAHRFSSVMGYLGKDESVALLRQIEKREIKGQGVAAAIDFIAGDLED